MLTEIWGNILMEKQEFKEAEENFAKSIKIKEESDNQSGPLKNCMPAI
ncbi:MAG: hypothetical protein CM1200mP16_02850 [Nitrospina sp.]|nr:MAG: hypothetical protein CM1200mP16_02850 [Nitrospina sp.]